MKFDPMTGEPINEENQNYDQQGYNQQGYDQQNYGQNYDYQNYDYQNYDYQNYQTTPPTSSAKKWLLPVLIGGGATVVAMVVAVVLFVSGAFLSPVQKLALASTNTFKEAGLIGEILNASLEASTSKEYTSSMMMEYQGYAIDVESRVTEDAKQVWAQLDMEGYPELQATLTFTDVELWAYAPVLGDYVFAYNYTEIPKGALFSQVDENAIVFINGLLTKVYEGDDIEDSEALKAMAEEFQTVFGELEIEEVDKKEFEINGKDVNCAGYEVVLDAELMTDVLEIILNGMYDYLDEMELDKVESVDMSELKDSIAETVESVEDMPEITFTFYLDSNMYAAIVMEVEDEEEELEILFQGGDYRAQNITIRFDDKDVFKIKGETDGDEENVEFVICDYETYNWETGESTFEDYTIAEYEYNKKSGEFELVLLSAGEAMVSLEGNIVCDKNGIAITDGEIISMGEKISFEASYKKGAEIASAEGKRFDIGNASEDEFMTIIMELQDELTELMEEFGDLFNQGGYDDSYDDWEYEVEVY